MASSNDPRIPNKQMRKLVQAAKKQGWTFRAANRSGHAKLTSPTGYSIPISSSPSDERGIKNTIAQLRRAGLKYP